MLAFAHVVDEVEPRQAGMAPFEVGHEARQDADDLATLGQRAVGDRAHRARGTTTVHDAVAVAREQFAEVKGRRAIPRIGLVAGSAVNADTHASRHSSRSMITSVPRLPAVTACGVLAGTM